MSSAKADHQPEASLAWPYTPEGKAAKRRLRHLLFARHHHAARYRQGIGGRLIHALPAPSNDNAALSTIRVRSRLGGLLNFYHRAVA